MSRVKSSLSLIKWIGIFFLLLSGQQSVAESSTNTLPKITKQQGKALTMLNQQTDQSMIKNLRVKLSQLKDSQGQTYIGAIVPRAELQPYLSQLKTTLNADFQLFRANQAARDGQHFHITIINPLEYPHVDKNLLDQLLDSSMNINFSSQLNVSLLGLGKAEKENKTTYFVVAQSNDGQLIRQRFLLKQADFHVTLGFNPSDIYDVKKDRSSLIH